MAHLTQTSSTRGPVVDVHLGVSSARALALRNAGQSIPSVQKLRGLLDTGASTTMADLAVFKSLRLDPVSKINIHTPSTRGQAAETTAYDVSLSIPNSHGMENGLEVANLRVCASDFSGVEPFQVLIGRDVLAHCVLIYNGSTGQFTLAY